jgi:hypothetical protein
VPRTSSTPHDQAVFADQATDANVFSDAVLLKIDRFAGIWTRRQPGPDHPWRPAHRLEPADGGGRDFLGLHHLRRDSEGTHAGQTDIVLKRYTCPRGAPEGMHGTGHHGPAELADPVAENATQRPLACSSASRTREADPGEAADPDRRLRACLVPGWRKVVAS